jgi:outer membrane receptor for ferrienterochelin and colicin
MMGKKCLCLGILLGLAFVFQDCSFAQNEAQGGGLSEEFLFTRLPLVYSTSKEERDVVKTPSPTTVWTKEEIDRTGVRTIEELLQRTVGFFTTLQPAYSLISSRGIIADDNAAYLFLVDGHSLNSVSLAGGGSSYLLPTLSKVERIEIIRGPGSTLWGTDAAMGIVNIITKSGSQIDGKSITFDTSSNNGATYGNLLYGKKETGGDFMFSGTYANNNGYKNKDGKMIHANAYNSATYDAGWWGGTFSKQSGPISSVPDSWELFTKMSLGNMRVTASATDVRHSWLWESAGDADNLLFDRRRHTWFEIANETSVADGKVETKIFTDQIINWDVVKNLRTSPDSSSGQEKKASREQSVGFDSMLTKPLGDSNKLKVGVRAVAIDIDPIYNAIGWNYPQSGVTASSTPFITYVVAKQRDLTYGLFTEDEWQISKDWELISGLRVDKNNLRDTKAKTLPRVALIWSTTENLTQKVMYNSGYIRPSASRGYLGQAIYDPNAPANQGTQAAIIVGAKESEEISSYDYQISWSSKRLRSNLTFYRTIMNNLFIAPGAGTTINGQAYQIDSLNANKITSNGVEFDWNVKVASTVTVDGNISHNFGSKINRFGYSNDLFSGTLANGGLFNTSRQETGIPMTEWNLGINKSFKFLGKDTINLNYRGFTGMWTLSNDSPVQYTKLGIQHFVDANLLFKSLLDSKFDLAIYAKNLLNNDSAKIAMPIFGGYYAAMGSSYGAKVTYDF